MSRPSKRAAELIRSAPTYTNNREFAAAWRAANAEQRRQLAELYPDRARAALDPRPDKWSIDPSFFSIHSVQDMGASLRPHRLTQLNLFPERES